MSLHACSVVYALCNLMDHRPPQDPLLMGFFSQQYWSGLPYPSPGDFPTLPSRQILYHGAIRQVELTTTVRNKFLLCVSHTVYGILLHQLEKTETCVYSFAFEKI